MKSFKSKRIALCALMISFVFSIISVKTYAQFEGGYCGNDPITPSVVYSFLKHFKYEQYYWARDFVFTTNNNSFVDYMDFAYYCGHGAPWLIQCYNGDHTAVENVFLNTVGYGPNKGYGDAWLKFIVFHSCNVIPSPLETSDWWQKWVYYGGIFDGLHMALGFRTGAEKSTAAHIANFYGTRMANANTSVLWSWFDALNAHGDRKHGDYGCAVMYPTAQEDHYFGSHIAKPDPNSTWLRVWYQY